ncbi:MAG: hypothetical protein V1735_00245 [Nanoarchaeota archaeon]
MVKPRWEVSFVVLRNCTKPYKVTRRIPDLSVFETLIFSDKRLALRKMRSWLEKD